MNLQKTLCDALDQVTSPVTFFFRDDDAGWANDHLFALLDRFAAYDMPIDLAVIPCAIDSPLAAGLQSRIDRNPRLLGLHQHGYAHVNHEPAGRKCEFGPSRTAAAQWADIATGQSVLQNQFGAALDAIFTPPWNRVSQHTIDCLIPLGFAALSRDAGTMPLNTRGLSEINVALDWQKKRSTDGSTDVLGKALASCIADSAASGQPIGIMLHHAVMDDADRENVSVLLRTLSHHQNAQAALMRNLVPADGAHSRNRSGRALRGTSIDTERIAGRSVFTSVFTF
jgi:predicted deacetylase